MAYYLKLQASHNSHESVQFLYVKLSQQTLDSLSTLQEGMSAMEQYISEAGGVKGNTGWLGFHADMSEDDAFIWAYDENDEDYDEEEDPDPIIVELDEDYLGEVEVDGRDYPQLSISDGWIKVVAPGKHTSDEFWACFPLFLARSLNQSYNKTAKS